MGTRFRSTRLSPVAIEASVAPGSARRQGPPGTTTMLDTAVQSGAPQDGMTLPG